MPVRDPGFESHVREAVRSRSPRRFSPVWIVPIVALLIGAWLVWQTYSERGPEVTIRFKSAAGIEAKKSVVKYKDIVVGKVTAVRFSPDLKSVLVTARLKKEMSDYLSENTRFWVVHARLSADSVEGLDTLLSGAYIGMQPRKGEHETRNFLGLEAPPVISDDDRGTRYVLEASEKGSLQIGSPIYYKKLKAGDVLSYHLARDGRKVLVDVFIHAPYDRLITDKTRFWNASGIYASIGTDGVEIRTESLTSILSGGIAFENFAEFGKGKPVASGHHFILLKDFKEAKKITYNRELYFWVYFDESIRGLKPGAPVEFRGVKIGEVVNYFLVGDASTARFRVPVLIRIEPERFMLTDSGEEKERSGIDPAIFAKLVAKGLRAQLQNANLLTGDLLVNLDFHADARPVSMEKKDGLYVLPSIPATLESLKANLKTLLERLTSIPFESIGKNLDALMHRIRTQTLPDLQKSFETLNARTLPGLDRTIEHLDRAVESVRKNYLDSNTAVNKRLIRLLDEITRTSRSIRNLSSYLERHPESLIRGK